MVVVLFKIILCCLWYWVVSLCMLCCCLSWCLRLCCCVCYCVLFCIIFWVLCVWWIICCVCFVVLLCVILFNMCFINLNVWLNCCVVVEDIFSLCLSVNNLLVCVFCFVFSWVVNVCVFFVVSFDLFSKWCVLLSVCIVCWYCRVWVCCILRVCW